MSDKIMLLPSDAPEPLEIYERVKIHPDNQRLLDERLARFRPLEKRERERLEKRRKELWSLLNKGVYKPRSGGLFARLLEFRWTRKRSYNFLVHKRYEYHQQFTSAREKYQTLLAKLKAADAPAQEAALPTLRQLRAKIRKLADVGKRLNQELQQLEPLHQEYLEVAQRLADHDKMLKDEAEERWQQKKFFREARIIEQIMLSTFARTGGAHHVWQDARGRHQTDVPKFQQSGSNADSHWFLLATTAKERFGHRDILPYTVDVETLVSERLVENLSVAVGFQVEVRRSPDLTKIYYRVNRLDSPDGLPKYFAFQTMFQFYPQRDHDLLPFPLGVFDNRRVKWSNLHDDAHILITGKTQHGKSNYLNNIIATWIQFHSPQELRLILCDLKGGVEFTAWRGIPHLLGDFVKFEKDLMPRLREARGIIARRLALLEKAGQTDIASYNRAVNFEQRLPRIVIVIDEMQTLLGRSKWTRAVHHHLSVIASQGRAPGVHLILCTQHPSKEVVPMPIKANMSLLVMFLMSTHSALTLMQDTAPSRLPPRVIGRVVFASGLEQDEAQTALILPDDKASAARFAIKTYAPSPWYIEAGSPDIAPPIETTPEQWETALSLRPALSAAVSHPIEAASAVSSRPPPMKAPGFTEEDLIGIALHNLDGRFAASRLYGIVKQQHLASEDRVNKMVKIVLERGTARYQGIEYEVKWGKGKEKFLIPLSAKQSSNPVIPTVITPETPRSDESPNRLITESTDHEIEAELERIAV